MKVKAKVFLRPDGTVEAVYRDTLFPLFGSITQVTRVTDVEFNLSSQTWESRDVHGCLLVQNVSRDQCVQEEHSIVEDRMRLACAV
jgi:hypothetical protein